MATLFHSGVPPGKRLVRNTLPNADIAACARLREARNYLRLSQTEFAEQIGITRERLASYEDARAPLKLGLALKICRQFIISEKWLAVGEPRVPEFGKVPSRLCASLELEKTAQILPHNKPFTELFEPNLKDLYYQCIEDTMPYPRLAIKRSDNIAMAHNALNCLKDIGAALVGLENEARLLMILIKSALIACLELSALTAEPYDQEPTKFEAVMSRHWAEIRPSHKKTSESVLTATSLKRNSDDVKPKYTIKGLIARLKDATKAPGAKAALAHELKVPQSRVSEWLNGIKEPSGEYALRLLSWVEDPARQK